MDLLDFIADYLADQEAGMKNLIAAFLNQAMLQEALQQAGAIPYERTNARKAHRNGYKDRSLKTRYGERFFGNHSFESSPSRPRYLGGTPVCQWRKVFDP